MGAVFGKSLVIVFRSHDIRMALHLEIRLSEFLHEVRDGIKRRVAVLGELRGVELEVDTLLELFKVVLLLERATNRINRDTRDGIRALVLVIGHLVLVAVERTPHSIDRSA